MAIVFHFSTREFREDNFVAFFYVKLKTSAVVKNTTCTYSHDFMDKMKTSDIVETKWGLSVDQSLGDKVKVTILATGFGVQNINTTEMDDRMKKLTEEERRLEAERTAKEIENEIRRINIYGTEGNGTLKHRPTYAYHFKDEDLDNDDVISMVESSPTYKRRREEIKLFDGRSNSEDNQ